jgi:hypothetical protein
MNSADEIVAIVDEHNNVIGAIPRREMRAKTTLASQHLYSRV